METIVTRLNLKYSMPGTDWLRNAVLMADGIDIETSLTALQNSLENDIEIIKKVIVYYQNNPNCILQILPDERDILILSESSIVPELINENITTTIGENDSNTSDMPSDADSIDSAGSAGSADSIDSFEAPNYPDLTNEESNYERKKKILNLLNSNVTGLNDNSDSDSDSENSYEDDIIDANSAQNSSLYQRLDQMVSDLIDTTESESDSDSDSESDK